MAPVSLPEKPGEKAGKGILVSFGGEDSSRLTEKIMDRILSAGIDPVRITVVKGPLFKRSLPEYPGADVRENTVSLQPLINSNRYLITSFGLTAYEGARAGLGVLLFSPTPYHKKLAKGAGFSSGEGKSLKALRFILAEDPSRLMQNNGKVLKNFSERTLSSVLQDLHPASVSCPVCGESGRSCESREPDRTYFRCIRCGIVFMSLFRPEALSDYSSDYFFDQYKAQYGKTYLEDFDHIKEMSDSRSSRLFRLLKEKSPAVLDIGCAYGPSVGQGKKRTSFWTGYRTGGRFLCQP